MSGHSKWANIKYRKGAADKKRGAVFTKLAKAITVAAREGGGADLEANFGLRLAIDKARAANMPKENIERAIARGAGGDKDGAQLEHVVYEGYGPQGSAVMLSALTDNRKRTVAEVRHLFGRYGGSLGESGSVAWQFEPRGMISVPSEGVDAEELALAAIDAGAWDVEVEDALVTVYTAAADFRQVKESLAQVGYRTDQAELAMVPTAQVELDPKATLQVMRFLEALEELEDVDQVWTNVAITDEAVAEFAAA
jgi:YebC/PmpR family DNA-binding regulatory protein